MKLKLLFIVMLSILFINKAHSQRYQDARNIHASFGFVPKGLSASLGYEKHLGWNSSYLIELSAFTEKEKVVNSDVKANFTSFTLGAKYRYYLFAYGYVLPFIGGGVFGGYELYSNKKDVPDNIFMDRKNQFIYGLNSDIGLEYNKKRTSLFIAYSPMYEFKMKDYIHQARLGVKYIF